MNGLFPYISYLIPTDGIQTVFLVIIVFLSVGTAIWVKLSTWQRKGKQNCWEKRWINGTPTDTTDDLKTEHGSVQELCDAVALPAEKLAEVLPSMLLVVGLMGTFLGVGVALNDATNVLKDSERPPMEMLREMVSMLDGLGALFKSSIYGIIGFFTFTLWSSKCGTEEKRFKWCVMQCNKELAGKESEIEKFQRFQKENTKAVITALNKVNASIGESIADCIQKSLQSALVKGFENVNKNLNDMNSALCLTLENTVVERFRALEKEMKGQVKETKNLVEQFSAQTSTMDSLSVTMKDQFTYVATSAKSMGEAAEALSKSVDEFKPAVTETLESIRDQFIKSITESSKVMENAGNSILEAVEKMSQASIDGQKRLDQTLTDFNHKISGTLSDIKQTTLAMESQGLANVEEMKELCNEIGDKLSSISRANLTIKSGMKELPNGLSQSIGATLEEVKAAIDLSVSNSAKSVTDCLTHGFNAVAKRGSVKEQSVAVKG